MASPEFFLTGESPAGVAMLIPISNDASEEDDEEFYFYSSSSSSSPSFKMPERLRRRMAEWRSRTSPISVEDIEAKLLDADRRRKKFYDQLSKKASPKRSNVSLMESSNEELERRIRARLLAAERKRESNIAKLQTRLAKLDELRQAAKTRVEIIQEKERKELRKRVESRLQKAESNRILLLKKDRLRRASLRERVSQSKLRRMARESKRKERVCASISQKRAAVEKKRLGLLEKKRRAHERFLQVQQVAQSVSCQREAERRRLLDQMESRLQRAKAQRAEFLKQRGRKHLMHDEQGDILSRKLARCWRNFLQNRRTTFSLARDFDDLQINEKQTRSMPFEQLADSIESRATLQAVKPFLDRLDFRLSILSSSENSPYGYSDIDHLLKKVAAPPPRRKVGHTKSTRRNRVAQKVGASMEAAKVPVKSSRYPVRLVLCAYMIIAHPEAVFNGRGEREAELAKSATELVKDFELLIKIILDGSLKPIAEESSSGLVTFRIQLAAFDAAWCTYLNNFVVWKVRDAESLEQDLVRAACQLELSMIQKCKLNAEGEYADLSDDLKAIKNQVIDDQNLLRGKVVRLGGDAGIRRLEQALANTRSQYILEKEKGSPSSSPTTPFLLPASPISLTTPPPLDVGESRERPKHVVRSLFGEGSSQSSIGVGSSGEKVPTENEIIVNEFMHKQNFPLSDSSNVNDDGINNLKDKVKETMETAFWDGILQSLKQVNPNYGRLINLMEEVRDELCNISPESWKEEIHEIINLEVLSEMLNAGNLDMDHMRKILEFALIMLQKLSAPANDAKTKEENEKLLKELSLDFSDETEQLPMVSVVKGLRFVLEQIQTLKKEISTTHVRMVETLLNGSAGVEYLQSAFSKHYGPPTDAFARLPLTQQWISSVRLLRDQEMEEHMNSLSRLMASQQSFSHGPLPGVTLRTGRYTLVETSRTPVQQASSEQPECQGEMIDSLVRIGILKLVARIAALNAEDVPETLRLNLSKLQGIQAQVQKITVILTSTLVIRQVILSKAIPVIPSLDMEKLLPRLADQLSSVLESNSDAGIKEIVDVIFESLEEEMNSNNAATLQAAKELIARVLIKSLQAGDSVFEMVSGAFYKAARGVILGGSGARGRQLVKIELQKMGAVFLADRVIEVAGPLVAMATVSVSVHRAWYANIVESGR